VCPGTSLWEADVPEGGDFLTLFSWWGGFLGWKSHC
jgi:hypothetical protein